MAHYPNFVWDGALTEAGKKVVAYLEDGIAKALSLVEGQDVTALNGMSGPFQDYYVNVKKARVITAEDFVKDRPYAVGIIWDTISAQEAAAAAAAQATEATATLESRLATLEAQLTEALKQMAAQHNAAPVTEATEDEDEPEAEPEPPAKKRKAKPAEEAEPPATNAEGDEKTETEA